MACPIKLWSDGTSGNVYLAAQNTFLEFYTDEEKAFKSSKHARSKSADSVRSAEPTAIEKSESLVSTQVSSPSTFLGSSPSNHSSCNESEQTTPSKNQYDIVARQAKQSDLVLEPASSFMMYHAPVRMTDHITWYLLVAEQSRKDLNESAINRAVTFPLGIETLLCGMGVQFQEFAPDAVGVPHLSYSGSDCIETLRSILPEGVTLKPTAFVTFNLKGRGTNKLRNVAWWKEAAFCDMGLLPPREDCPWKVDVPLKNASKFFGAAKLFFCPLGVRVHRSVQPYATWWKEEPMY